MTIHQNHPFQIVELTVYLTPFTACRTLLSFLDFKGADKAVHSPETESFSAHNGVKANVLRSADYALPELAPKFILMERSGIIKRYAYTNSDE